MKQYRLAVFLSAFLLFACSKNSNSVKPSLIGKWTLVETLADPGDGSGTWMAVNNTDHFLEFKAFNRIETNAYPGRGNLTQYQILNDSLLSLMSNTGDTFTFYFKIKDSSLTIRGGCIEACGNKFIKASF